jgi:hypothetical protein
MVIDRNCRGVLAFTEGLEHIKRSVWSIEFKDNYYKTFFHNL